MMEIYHNPKCSKSRQTLALVEQNTSEFEVIKYLENSLKFDDIELLLVKLNAKPIDIVRTKEEIWKENFKGKEMNDDEIINVLVENPRLMERPIVTTKEKAIIGRPPENVLELFN
ncbi:MAG: arsenate reductase (glutaredoxin) [Flavobacteriales bacterium]|nr:arsenate reductase (glutaredoxin) [Flavobacteriales bacterium]